MHFAPVSYGKSGRGFEIRCKTPVVTTTVQTLANLLLLKLADIIPERDECLKLKLGNLTFLSHEPKFIAFRRGNISLPTYFWL